MFGAVLWLVPAATRRWTADRALGRIVLAACLLRAVLATTFYLASLWELPLLRSLQLGHGFWLFAPDASYFDEYARGAATALRAGLSLPFVYGSPEFPLVVTAAYWLIGAHPLLIVWLNVTLAAVTIALGYLIARRIWSVEAGRVTAALIAFWPSSVLWSTQMLKDTLENFLVMAFLWGFLQIAWPSRSEGRGIRPAAIAAFAVTFVSLFAAVRFRHYVALALLGASVTVLGIRSVAALVERRYAGAARAAAVAAWLFCGLWVATWIPVERLGKPVDPQPGLQALARYMVSVGDTDGARRQLELAAWIRAGAGSTLEERQRVARDELARLSSSGSGFGTQDAAPSSERPALEPIAGIAQLLSYLSLSSLAETRTGFQSGGSSGTEPSDMAADDVTGLIGMAPAALGHGLLSPNPWTHLNGSGSTGVFRTLAMVEMFVALIVVAFSVEGAVSAWHRAWPAALVIVLFSVTLLTALGYAVPNIGILFRLRLAALIPLCVLAGGSRLRHLVTAPVPAGTIGQP
jgi:hypothetical protein